MLQRKEGVSIEDALRRACKKNDIVLTPKGSNHDPVCYVDTNGNTVDLRTGEIVAAKRHTKIIRKSAKLIDGLLYNRKNSLKRYTLKARRKKGLS